MDPIDKDALQAELKKWRVCRFCLSQDHPKLTNIYMRDTRIKSSAPLPIQIMAIASIEVFSTDDMPSYVCSDCTSTFEFSYQFKQMCKKADNLLRQFPLTGKWPDVLDKPILRTNLLPQITIATPSKTKIMQGRMQNSARSSGQQESLLLPKKILNATVNPKPIASDVVITPDTSSKSERDMDYTITFLDKIENNDEISLDDIHQLVAAEDKNEKEYVAVNNIKLLVAEPENQSNKPKLLNKSSIRILNKEAEQENEPRLSLPKIKKDADGKTEIVAEILNVGDEHEAESDPKNAAVIATNVFPCTLCERTFPLLQLRDIHMKNHYRDRKFHCESCEKSFFSKYDLQRHSYIHTGDKPFKCSLCEQAFSRSSLLTRHEKSHTDVPKYICVHCERAFLLKEDLEKHVERHKINRPFVCKICNKRFAFKQGVERHEIVHSRQQPYTCQYCEESFSTTTKLSRHLTAHAGRRPYPCKYCKKSFLLSHHLTRHLRSHKYAEDPINAISFMCMRCNSNFLTRDELITHSAMHANEMNLACPLCKDIFDNMLDLTSHIQNHSEGEAFACEFCDLIFITAEKLQSHTDIDHVNEMEAYHTDDNARSNNLKEDNKSQIDILDEKFQETVTEFLNDEYLYEGNSSEHPLKKDIKKEKEIESPKIINQIIIQSHNDEDATSLLVPLKQRKLDSAATSASAQSTMSEQTTKSPILRRKTPNAKETSVRKESNQPTIKSLLKMPEKITNSSKTPAPKTNPTKKILAKTSPPKTAPSKTLPSKTPPSRTPPSKTPVTLLSKKMDLVETLPTPKIIKDGKERSEATSSSSLKSDTSKIKKKVKVQRITVTKAQAAAMVKEGRIKIEDGKIILKK